MSKYNFITFSANDTLNEIEEVLNSYETMEVVSIAQTVHGMTVLLKTLETTK